MLRELPCKFWKVFERCVLAMYTPRLIPAYVFPGDISDTGTFSQKLLYHFLQSPICI